MAATGGGMRTIWITLRAINYTGRIFSAVISDLEKLKGAEAQIVKHHMMMGQYALMAGMMFNALGQQVGGTAGTMMNALSYTMMMLGGFEMLISVLKVLNVELRGLHVTTQQIVISMAAFTAGFTVAYLILQQLRSPLASLITILAAVAIAFWSVYIAKSAAFPIAAAMGGIAAAASLALMEESMNATTPEYQTGTRYAPYTGLAKIHKGEIIYNPYTNLPTQVGNEISRGEAGTNVWNLPITIQNVHTKADIDDIDEEIRKALRRNLRVRK